MRDSCAHVEDLSAVYARHRRQAVARSSRILKDATEAEDLVQDLFLRLWEDPTLRQSIHSFGAWLDPVMDRRAINAHRARARRKKLVHLPEGTRSPEDEACAHEIAAAVDAALQTLSAQHREAFVLRELEGLSYSEIARRWSVPAGTVKSALFRARAKLQEALTASTRRPSDR